MNQPEESLVNVLRRSRPLPPKKRNPLLLPLVIVSVVAIVMSALYIGTSIRNFTPQEAFSEAVEVCELEEDSPYIAVVDDGATLIMSTKGTESPGASVGDVACVFLMLEVPASILNRFNTTRALDGTQTGTWEGYEATWNYHPNSGSNITITVARD